MFVNVEKCKFVLYINMYILKIAGVSITVTSVTDLIAFAVGASSDLAAYASFSVYAAMCIILLFFLEVSDL